MTYLESEGAIAVPEQGNLVRVRDRYWVVESICRSSRPDDPMSPNGWTRHYLVGLVPIDDKGSPSPLSVFWETEPGTEIRPQSELPDPEEGLDEAEVFAGFLDAVRWGAVASTNPKAFQSPFRSGIDIEDYQLLPLVKALRMPRVSLLIADDVGLGKTVEAGLIAQELVLRNQAQKILVVCPPSLCRKWQREMREQFGLAFEIIDTEHVRRLRRERGVGVNPFRSHPRLVVSMEWIKFEAQMRWFDEFLPPDPNIFPRAFDLLIVDEAHRIAPSAVGRYARDSLRTKVMRRLTPHFEHRLFLTATPHNGYHESFQALLEMLDQNRFTKGVPPSKGERDAVMVRRLKSHLRTMLPDGEKRFPKRRIFAIEVDFTPEDRELFKLLDRYAALRMSAASTPTERAASRFIVLLLKKRLLSSPAAFKYTLAHHIHTLNVAAHRRTTKRALQQAEAALENEADDTVPVSVQEQEALALAAGALASFGADAELEVLARMRARTVSAANTTGDTGTVDADQATWILDRMSALIEERWRRADAKTKRLLDWIGETCFPDGEWNDERIIVFTEYRATLNYLEEMLAAKPHGWPSMRGRVEVFHGSLDTDERERIIREFNYNPRKTKVRVLLATDAASEGIDLHRACHRLVHMEVPFNPNRMEQRNGRIDRHGQKSETVDIFHFASTNGDGDDDDHLGYDHSFLLRLARKIDDIRDDLGSVSSVLAERIEARMLREGNHSLDIDDLMEIRRDQARVDLQKLKAQFSADIERVREQYNTSVEELDLKPENVQRAVEVALRIEGQPPLRYSTLERPDGGVPVFEIDDLAGTWGETLVGLQNEVEDFRLPVTFDPQIATGHQDVAYLHVGHPLVARCLRTLRAQVWGAAVDRKINRVAVRYADIDEPVVVAHARVVVNGSDGSTLDEVIEPAAVRVGGRQRRLNVGETRAAVTSACSQSVPDHVCARYTDQWGRVQPALQRTLEVRAEEVRSQRGRAIDAKRENEEKRLRGTLKDLQLSIWHRLDELEESNSEQLRLFDSDEREQFDADVRALRDRVEQIDSDIEKEVEILKSRYRVRDVNWFPVAVEFLVPQQEC
ncbi:MAG: DISARM system SNF2-like helicase DrmD [Acidimicrobiaceae bacterium]|nr:DISARM system SNF2-like helicase DrmD [Acidimicrobiaceae bacterium]